jgi:hypothetical protein
MIGAALLTGRVRAAARLGATLFVATLVLLLAAQGASAGRAFRVWAACMFAGSDSAGTLSMFLSGGFLTGLLNSHLVTIAGLVALSALLVSLLAQGRGFDADSARATVVPAAFWLGATVALGVTLSSPGTVPSNQVIEWIATSLLVPAMVAGGGRLQVRLRSVVAISIAGLVVWMGLQNVARASEMRQYTTPQSLAQRQRFVEHVRLMSVPILAESALWPILAGREVVLPDAFAARVVLGSHPDIEKKLIQEIGR